MTDKEQLDIEVENSPQKHSSHTTPKIHSRRTKGTTRAITPLSQAASKNTSRMGEHSEQDYEYKHMNTDDLFAPIEHTGIEQKPDTIYNIDPRVWNNTPPMLYNAICTLVENVDALKLMTNLQGKQMTKQFNDI